MFDSNEDTTTKDITCNRMFTIILTCHIKGHFPSIAQTISATSIPNKLPIVQIFPDTFVLLLYVREGVIF